jgi:hypothetical protein
MLLDYIKALLATLPSSFNAARCEGTVIEILIFILAYFARFGRPPKQLETDESSLVKRFIFKFRTDDKWRGFFLTIFFLTFHIVVVSNYQLYLVNQNNIESLTQKNQVVTNDLFLAHEQIRKSGFESYHEWRQCGELEYDKGDYKHSVEFIELSFTDPNHEQVGIMPIYYFDKMMTNGLKIADVSKGIFKTDLESMTNKMSIAVRQNLKKTDYNDAKELNSALYSANKVLKRIKEVSPDEIQLLEQITSTIQELRSKSEINANAP